MACAKEFSILFLLVIFSPQPMFSKHESFSRIFTNVGIDSCLKFVFRSYCFGSWYLFDFCQFYYICTCLSRATLWQFYFWFSPMISAVNSWICGICFFIIFVLISFTLFSLRICIILTQSVSICVTFLSQYPRQPADAGSWGRQYTWGWRSRYPPGVCARAFQIAPGHLCAQRWSG